MRLILASTSPRRKELLALLGYPFDVVPPAFTECLMPGQPADTQAKEFAFQKAASCAVREPDATVLGSDTVIALDEEVIGKPRDHVTFTLITKETNMEQCYFSEDFIP